MEQKSNRSTFVKLAENRVSRALKDIQLIGNLSNKSNYSYTDEDVKKINSLGNLCTNLSRLGIDQINTLERIKGKGQQKIIVEKVNIEAGGKAAIGVYEGVGANAKKGL